MPTATAFPITWIRIRVAEAGTGGRYPFVRAWCCSEAVTCAWSDNIFPDLLIGAGERNPISSRRSTSEQGGRNLKLLSGLMMFGLGLVLLLAPELLDRIATAVFLIVGSVLLTSAAAYWRRVRNV